MGLRRLLQYTQSFGVPYSRLLALRRRQLLISNSSGWTGCIQCQFFPNSFVSMWRTNSLTNHTSFQALNACTNNFHTDGSDRHDGEEEATMQGDEDTEVPFLREICSIPDAGHHVLVIQPAVKTGPKKAGRTTPELQLAETCALVSTLPRWKVVRQKILPVKQPSSLQIFGSGTFRQLKREIADCQDISAVVMGTDLLSGGQLAELHNAWKVPVFDRYTIVLQIFKEHARTKEAKLQVALAEIPFVRSRLSQIHQGDHDRQVGGASLVGGTGETYIARRRQILQEKETKLKKALQKVKSQRSLLRQNRQRSKIPTVAVVGYTNAGKTTLIKALTGDAELEPKDQLFATLDVTAHAGKLPNNMTAIFMDTVGFISDIPVTLIDAFAATLEDAVLADLVLHVRDISHPDTVAQKENVVQTLSRMLSPQQLRNMIEVWNKADKHQEWSAMGVPSKAVVTSAVTGEGMGKLREVIQGALITTSGQLEKCFRIPMQGPMLAWLYKEATVRSADADPSDPEHLLVDVIISEAAYQRFKAAFNSKRNNKRS